MRTLAFSILLVVVSAASIAGDAGDSMTQGDRQRLVAHLEMTESWLVSELDGLSDAQVKFRPTPESWSITEVVEHLAIAEPQYWQRVRDSMKQPPTTEKPTTTDAQILWYGIDRTNRARTGEARVPKGKYATAAAALADVRKLRAEMLEYARSTQDDLRSHKLLEGNQVQIRENKANAGYPKK